MKQYRTLFSVSACLLMLSACGGSNDDDTAGISNVSIPFAAKSGSTEITCGAALSGLGSSADGGTVADFAFYVHDIQLIDKNGTKHATTLESNDFQDAEYGVALLDFQDKGDSCQGSEKPVNTMVDVTVDGVDPADITGVAFKVGVPSEINHHEAATSQPPYNRSGLFWKWQTGHKFMRLDINPASKVQLGYDVNGVTEANTYFFHLGSTGCEGDPVTGEIVSCGSPNHPQVELTDGFSVNNLTSSTVVFDYAKFVAGVNLNVDMMAPSGCMSGPMDPECVTLFNHLGMKHGSTAATGSQTVFSVEN
ncbi:MAG: metallo-mystery pair system four-Cys motif protein [Thiolinea sp.]